MTKQYMRLAIFTSIFFASNVMAGYYNFNKQQVDCNSPFWITYYPHLCTTSGGGSLPPSSSVVMNSPELSAAAAPMSIALVMGMLALGLERRRKQKKH